MRLNDSPLKRSKESAPALSTAMRDILPFSSPGVTVQADPEYSIGMRMTAEGQLLLECR
jgi:hypothetical protein